MMLNSRFYLGYNMNQLPFIFKVFSLLTIITSSNAQSLPPERQQQLLYLLRQDCGSCHGMLLTGGLGPALTPAALAGKPSALLVNTVLQGRAGTPMPPWNQLLSPSEAEWLVQQLQQGTPPLPAQPTGHPQ